MPGEDRAGTMEGLRLDGDRIAVTGAASEIGRAIAPESIVVSLDRKCLGAGW